MQVVTVQIPESADQPFQSLETRSKKQTAAYQPEKAFYYNVQLFVLLCCHVDPLLAFALLTEEILSKGRESGVQHA